MIALTVTLMAIATSSTAQVEDQSRPIVPGVVLDERVIRVPGDPARPANLQVTVLAPPGPGPFPLAVVNHGATGVSATARGQRDRRTFVALYFLSRGYAVALPMMRGFAQSDGELPDHGCNVAELGRDNAKDIRAVIAFMGGQPDIDAHRVVVTGQSYGGWNTLALGADAPPNVVGLIDFVGGVRSSGCGDDDAPLIAGAAAFGRATRIPSIWFWGDNDSLFPAALWRRMYARYTAAGGPAELVAFGRFEPDSHELTKYAESLPVWTPRVDAFLAGIGMPSLLVHPEYLPKPWPKPTGFAAIDDLDAAPLRGNAIRKLYRAYLKRANPKVFLIGSGGFARIQFDGFDPVSEGKAACRQLGQVCRVYAVDDRVVWIPAPDHAPPRQ